MIKKKIELLRNIRKKIQSETFKRKYRTSSRYFTRDRKLIFTKMIALMTRKSVKSLQNILNETEIYLSYILERDLNTVSKGAYTQARKKIDYEAFIELSNDIRDQFYSDGEYLTFKGYRLLGIDGTLITLPNTYEIEKRFGVTRVVNQHKEKSKTIAQGRISLLYDLLNGIVIDAVMTSRKEHEIKTAKQQLKAVKPNDLIIFDRNYPSYEMYATIMHRYKANFLMRIKKSTYKTYTAPLFDKDGDVEDITVTLKPVTKEVVSVCQRENFPLEIKVRFVKILLDNGDVEVLATSILDHTVLSTKDFKALYFKRWKIETCYDVIKNRLALENFTGTTPLAVRQDFYATVFITNIEAIVTYDLNLEFAETSQSKRRKYRQKVNKSVSFNTIKNYAFELFYFETDIEDILEKIY